MKIVVGLKSAQLIRRGGGAGRGGNQHRHATSPWSGGYTAKTIYLS